MLIVESKSEYGFFSHRIERPGRVKPPSCNLLHVFNCAPLWGTSRSCYAMLWLVWLDYYWNMCIVYIYTHAHDLDSSQEYTT